MSEPLDDITSGQQIARNHGADHLDDFPELTSMDELADLIDGIIFNPDDAKVLARGRSAYWSEDGIVVIVDPNSPHGSSAFRPDDGWHYFDTLE